MHRKKIALVSVGLAVTLMSACSSGGDAPGAGASEGSISAGVQAAKDATAQALKEPTIIPLTEPLKEKPEAGKTFVFMKCDQPDCVTQADRLKEATDALGWIYKDVPFKAADPATLVSGMKQALTLDPVAVGVPSQPEAVFRSVLQDYKAAGVPIVASFTGPMAYDDMVIGQVGADLGRDGEMLANYAIADSDGEAHVLLQTVPSLVILESFVEGYKKTIEASCPKCTVTMVENTIPQLSGGQVNGTLIAALQKNPKINYIALSNGLFGTGLVPALDAAGLSDQVEITGQSGSTTDFTNVKAGTEAAFTGIPVGYSQWAMIDMVLRYLQGMPFEPAQGGEYLPGQLLTKDVDFEVSASYDKPNGWQEQFEELWHVK